MSDQNNDLEFTTDQYNSSAYSIHIQECRFAGCFNSESQAVGSITEDGLSLTVENWTAKISHEAPGVSSSITPIQIPADRRASSV